MLRRGRCFNKSACRKTLTNAVPVSPLPFSISAGAGYVTQADLKFMIFLPQLPEGWDHRSVIINTAPSRPLLPSSLSLSFLHSLLVNKTMVGNTLLSGYSLGGGSLHYLALLGLCVTVTVTVHTANVLIVLWMLLLSQIPKTVPRTLQTTFRMGKRGERKVSNDESESCWHIAKTMCPTSFLACTCCPPLGPDCLLCGQRMSLGAPDTKQAPFLALPPAPAFFFF